MSTPQPGWYPDPDDETRARYWDGQGWTDRTRERSATGAEPGEQDSPTNSGRPFWRKPAAAVALAVALVVAVGAFVLLSSSQAGAEVILEPTASTGTDPFTESVANKSVLELTSSPQTELAGEPVEGFAGNGAQTESLSGATPGLYGGTGKEAVCDPQALVGFLEHNPDKARAFAAVFGIKPKGIADYVSGLTPLLLREDTRVTNHGFSDGVANPFDAVLQAGTAVLVDDRGVPRVRCACGNPLSEPTAIETAPSYSGDSWQSFDENRVLAVAPANQQIDSFEVVDVETGKSYEEAAGGGQITVKQMLNARMPAMVSADGTEVWPAAKWKDGVHPDSTTAPSTAGVRFAAVFGADPVGNAPPGTKPETAVGDLTGDGLDEGVVARGALSCGGSCTSLAADLVVFGPRGDAIDVIPVEVGSATAGVSDLRIADGAIELTATGYAPSDPTCCPSLEVSKRYKWNGSDLVEGTSGSSAASAGSGSPSSGVSYRTYRSEAGGWKAKVPTGGDWSDGKESQLNPGLHRTTFNGPGGTVLLIDSTPSERPAYAGDADRSPVDHPAFDGVEKLIFSGNTTITPCETKACVDYLIPSGNGGYAVLAGGGIGSLSELESIAGKVARSLRRYGG